MSTQKEKAVADAFNNGGMEAVEDINLAEENTRPRTGKGKKGNQPDFDRKRKRTPEHISLKRNPLPEMEPANDRRIKNEAALPPEKDGGKEMKNQNETQGKANTEVQIIDMRPIWPRIQAIANQILDVPQTKECRVEVHRAAGQTFLTITPDRKTGVATTPDTVFPNSWKLTCAMPMQKGIAGGVAFIANGRATSIRAYRTLPPNGDKAGLRLYNFAPTVGNTCRAYTLQVDANRRTLIIEWSISVIDAHSAKRTKENTLVDERLPLHDLERTKKSLPTTLAPLAETLCFLFTCAQGKPVVPQKQTAAPAPPTAAPQT